MSKNIQVIDGAINSTFNIFIVSEEQFNVLFPSNKDIAFLDDFPELLDSEAFWNEFYRNKALKNKINGIHGTLHLTGSYVDKDEFPSRKEDDIKKSF